MIKKCFIITLLTLILSGCSSNKETINSIETEINNLKLINESLIVENQELNTKYNKLQEENALLTKKYVDEFEAKKIINKLEYLREKVTDNQLKTIKNSLYVGMTKSEVSEVLTQDYVKVTAVLDGEEVWRFDYSQLDYLYEETQLDNIDINGLKTGDMYLQLFVIWDIEESLKYYATYYLKENIVYEYRYPNEFTRKINN